MFSSFTNSTKTIAIMGATGAQGGAAVQAFHQLKESGNEDFEIRAITRDPTQDKAVALEPFVKEVVKANGDDEESMVSALEGCHGLFVLTNFWEDLDVDHEMKTMRTVKEAAKKADVKHVVLSSFEDSRQFVNNAENKDTWKVIREEGGMYTPHIDGKGEVALEYMDELPTTELLTSFYYENFIYFGMGPSRQADTDPYGITFPIGNAPMAMVAVADIGKCICAIFQDESLIGKSVGVKSTSMTGQEIADVFSKVCGQTVNYNAVPVDVYASFPFPGATELANMFRFYEENAEAFNAARDLDPKMEETMGGTISLEEYVTANKEAFVLEPPKEAPAPKKTARNETVCNCTIQ
jgi:hypothetical protein